MTNAAQRPPWPSRIADLFWRRLAFPYREVFSDDGLAFERAQVLVRITYVIWFLYSMAAMRALESWHDTPPALLWQVSWMAHVPWRPAMFTILGTASAAAMLTAMFPAVRLLRIVTFLAIFEFQGIMYARGKIDHSYHAWVFALLLMMFLPRLSQCPTPREKRAFLEVVWGIQAVAFACYSVAGIQKLWGAWIDWGHGPTIFDPTSLARQVARLIMNGDAEGLLSGLVLRYPEAAHPLILGALYLEVFAIFAVFRPRLHMLWGAGMIGMHAGIALVMNIWFDPMILMVGIWFLASPFAPARLELNPMLRDLPWAGQALAALDARIRLRRRIARVVIFYDGDCGICSRIVRTLLRAGLPNHYYFATQQGETWHGLLAEKPYLQGADTVAVLTETTDGARQLRLRSEAVLWTLAQLRFPFCLAWLALWIPEMLRDPAYCLIASNRKRLSATLPGNACPLAPAELRQRLLD